MHTHTIAALLAAQHNHFTSSDWVFYAAIAVLVFCLPSMFKSGN